MHRKVIYRHTKGEVTGTLLQDRLFEKEPHGIDEISQIPFTTPNLKQLVVRATENNETLLSIMGDEGEREQIYTSIVSSQLYHLLLNFVKIPTNSRATTETSKIYVCKLTLLKPDDYAASRSTLDCLCFIGIPLDTEVLIEECVYDHLVKKFDTTLNVDLISEHETHYKRATLDVIENPYEVMSITRQETYCKRCKEVLMYRALNPDTAKDNSRLDNLQFYLIEQQLCFGLYLALQPVLAVAIVTFSRIRKIADPTGNMFFSLYLPQKTVNGLDKISLMEIVHLLLDYGFYISHEDIEKNIRFSNQQEPEIAIKIKDEAFDEREADSVALGKNPMYSLLFRLLDTNYSDSLSSLDDLILSKKNDEFDVEVLKLLA